MNEFYNKIDKMFTEKLSEVPVSVQGQYDFNKDLKKGKDGENVVENHLISLGFKFISKNNGKEYDRLMSFEDKEIKYEIKTDMYPEDTGNMVIEFESRGEPSGINITTADYFVTYYPKFQEIWYIKTDILRTLIKENNFKISKESGDKGSNTKLYKIPRRNFIYLFKVYDIST